MTSYELTHFKKMVRVWKTKSLMVFWTQNHITFIFIENDVTWLLNANGLFLLLSSWILFPNSARSHWLLRGHMTSNNETVSRQNLWADNIAKSMAFEGNSALLLAHVDRRPPFKRGFMNFQLENFQLCNKSLKDWSLVPLVVSEFM